MDILSFFNKTLNRESNSTFEEVFITIINYYSQFIQNRLYTGSIPIKPFTVLPSNDHGVIIIIGTDKDYVYKMVQMYPQFTFLNIVRNEAAL